MTINLNLLWVKADLKSGFAILIELLALNHKQANLKTASHGPQEFDMEGGKNL